MSNHAKGTLEVTSWDEKTWDGRDRSAGGYPKLTHAVVAQTLTGEIQGESTTHFQMMYAAEDAATFVGLQQITGRIGDRAGSFVLQIDGVFAEGTARGDWSVVPGSGTGDLAGLRGQGGFVSVDHARSTLTLDYTFEA